MGKNATLYIAYEMDQFYTTLAQIILLFAINCYILPHLTFTIILLALRGTRLELGIIAEASLTLIVGTLQLFLAPQGIVPQKGLLAAFYTLSLIAYLILVISYLATLFCLLLRAGRRTTLKRISRIALLNLIVPYPFTLSLGCILALFLNLLQNLPIPKGVIELMVNAVYNPLLVLFWLAESTFISAAYYYYSSTPRP